MTTATVEQILSEVQYAANLFEVRLRDNTAERIAQRFKHKLAMLFRDQQERVMQALARKAKAEGLREQKYNADDWARYIFTTENEAEAFGLAFGPYVEQAYRMGGMRGVTQLNMILGFNVRYERAENWVRDHAIDWGTKHAKLVNKATAGLIKNELAEAFEAGEGIIDIEKRMGEIFGYSIDHRTEVIARTATADAYCGAKHDEYGEAGVRMHSWFWSGTEERCPDGTCPDNAAQGEIPLDEPFQSGHFHPPAHPNCTCDEIPGGA